MIYTSVNALPRRRALFTAGAGLLATIAGSRQARAAPATPKLEFAFEERVRLDAESELGITPFGRRSRAPIIGGTIAGPRIHGTVLSGGMDFQLLRGDGYLQLDADYLIRADDGAIIHVRNRGLFYSRSKDWPADYAAASPVFEAPIGPHDWLNKSIFVSTISEWHEGPGVIVDIFRVI
jgi:hypothetical protein